MTVTQYVNLSLHKHNLLTNYKPLGALVNIYLCYALQLTFTLSLAHFKANTSHSGYAS